LVIIDNGNLRTTSAAGQMASACESPKWDIADHLLVLFGVPCGRASLFRGEVGRVRNRVRRETGIRFAVKHPR
jgi:hypothetical protein